MILASAPALVLRWFAQTPIRADELASGNARCGDHRVGSGSRRWRPRIGYEGDLTSNIGKLNRFNVEI